ncbi:CD9 antigen-like [Carcharodon carcharias]|uniref:CD9 antigen-like n=1 Tax=Carcharodon carcharias TaxID=13397 RepID=UPI001B7E587B|nr:CD9 antigen-like [Carcharodon carcharias]
MGSVSGGMRCMKYLLFTFNLFFWLTGTAVFSLGLWLRFDSETTTIFSGDHCPTSFYIGVYTLIATGALMMLVGFLGCCGAVHESQCLLGAFFVCLLVIFAAEITAGVWGFLNKHEILQEMNVYYSKSLHTYRITGAGNRTLHAIHNVAQSEESQPGSLGNPRLETARVPQHGDSVVGSHSSVEMKKIEASMYVMVGRETPPLDCHWSRLCPFLPMALSMGDCGSGSEKV